jgi:hypothetical protein
MIYAMAKKLGISESEIERQYTLTEIAERNLFDVYDDFVEREMLKVK